ncbi:MAG: DNA polymerase I [Minicystis sp.]
MNLRPTVLPPPGAADVLYLIDLSGFVFRAYHAVAPLTSPTGEPTHATYGTVNMLAKLIDERKPVYLGVAMDSPGPRQRNDLDVNYKAHRPPAPEDLKVQMVRCREFIEAYRIPVFIEPGLEADDLLAAAVKKAVGKGLRVVIASGDKDLMQLVDGETVMMWDAMRDRVYGVPEVSAKFGVPPDRLRDLLALMGDSSDNVPGVPGVGAKTAAELMTQFATLDDLYAHLDDVKKVKIRESLKANEADARLSQKLVTLHADTPIDLDLETLRYDGPDRDKLRALFIELGFTRLVKALPAPSAPAVTLGGKVETILTREALASFAAEIKAAGRVALAVHGSATEPMRAQIVGLALAVAADRSAYLPITHRYLGAPAQLSLADVRELLGPLFADATIEKIGHDLKFAEVLLAQNELPLAGASLDTMLASYLLDPEAASDLPALAERDAGVTLTKPGAGGPPKKRGQAARTFDEMDVGEAAAQASPLVEVTLPLADRYWPRLRADEKLDVLLRDVELPLSHLLAGMEQTGVLVDPVALDALAHEMAKELTTLEEKAREAAGQDFNLGSPKQLETVLFDVLKLRSSKKTKTGRSTDAEVLEALVDDHPLPKLILDHRAIAKLKGTYVDALPRLIHPKTGRVHTHWNQAAAATGRISSEDPNLQNIPIRSALGKLIRRAFIAPPGHVIVSADYSQIELRVLAHLSHDPVLVDAFRTGQDVHVRTAMEVFGVSADDVTEDMRRKSKTINFGVIYGMGESALSKRLGITRQEAARFIDAYFARYVGVKSFMETTMADARRTDVVHTLFGRRRLVPDLRNTDQMRRSQAERIAQNTPIQGTAADLIKMAMVKLAKPVVPGARMVLTVHDELAFEVPEERAAEAAEIIRAAMEQVVSFDVPLVVDVGAGKTWADT